MDESEHQAAKVERAFSAQAAAFEDPRLNRIFTADAAWAFERLDPGPDAVVLDVAAGTGHVARALAPRVRCVIALDATAAMLATGKAAADAAGLRNVVFQRGDAAALPFPDASFDAVVSRFAVHHFADPRVQVAEMARCLRPGGTLVIGDLIATDAAGTAETQNELERLRDPSHTRMLSAAGLQELVGSGGLSRAWFETRDVRRPLDPWLAQTSPGPDAVGRITAALRAELAGGPATGFRPWEGPDGALGFVHTIASIGATRP